MPDVSLRAVARNIFRWAKTVDRKTPSKRFGLRTVLSKNQFGALPKGGLAPRVKGGSRGPFRPT